MSLLKLSSGFVLAAMVSALAWRIGALNKKGGE